MAKAGNLKLDYMAKSIGIHIFRFEGILRCYRDNENLKQPFGRMDTLKIYYRLRVILKRCVLNLVSKESKVSEYLIETNHSSAK